MAQHDPKPEIKRVKDAAKLEKLRQANLDKAINMLAERLEGRDLLWWLLEQCHIAQQPFTANALTTSFNCGEMNVGLKIQSRIIEANPAVYVRMMQERQDAGRADDSSSNNSSVDNGGASASGPGNAAADYDPYAPDA